MNNITAIKKRLSELGLPTDMLSDDQLDQVVKLAEEHKTADEMIQPKKQPRKSIRIKPNEKCLCGSDIKYKKCCGSYEKVNKK